MASVAKGRTHIKISLKIEPRPKSLTETAFQTLLPSKASAEKPTADLSIPKTIRNKKGRVRLATTPDVRRRARNGGENVGNKEQRDLNSFDSNAATANFLRENSTRSSQKTDRETEITFRSLSPTESTYSLVDSTEPAIPRVMSSSCHKFATNEDLVKEFERYSAVHQVRALSALKSEFLSWFLLLGGFVLLLFYRAEKVAQSCSETSAQGN